MNQRIGPDDVLGDGVPEWRTVLQRLCAVVPGGCAVHHLSASRVSSYPYSCAADPASMEDWSCHMARSESTRAALRDGETVRVAVGARARRTYVLAAALRGRPRLVSVVHFRSRPQAPEEAAAFTGFLRVLRRAWSIEEDLQPLREARERAEGALDLAPLSLVVVDGSMRVLFANRMARDLMDTSPDALRSEAEKLVCPRTDATRLRNAVRSVIAGRAPSLTVPVGHGVRRKPLAVTVRSVPTGAALLLITDPETPPVPADTLAPLFSLTAAEARLASAIMGGHTLDGAATEFGVSVHTVRSQLRRLFEKTGTSRQSELVRLLLGATRGL